MGGETADVWQMSQILVLFYLRRLPLVCLAGLGVTGIVMTCSYIYLRIVAMSMKNQLGPKPKNMIPFKKQLTNLGLFSVILIYMIFCANISRGFSTAFPFILCSVVISTIFFFIYSQPEAFIYFKRKFDVNFYFKNNAVIASKADNKKEASNIPNASPNQGCFQQPRGSSKTTGGVDSDMLVIDLE